MLAENKFCIVSNHVTLDLHPSASQVRIYLALCMIQQRLLADTVMNLSEQFCHSEANIVSYMGLINGVVLC